MLTVSDDLFLHILTYLLDVDQQWSSYRKYLQDSMGIPKSPRFLHIEYASDVSTFFSDLKPFKAFLES